MSENKLPPKALYTGAPPAHIPADVSEAFTVWADEKFGRAPRPDETPQTARFASKFEAYSAGAAHAAAVLRGLLTAPQPQAVAATSPATAVDARLALEKIAGAEQRDEFPGHHNNARHVRCMSCFHRWPPGIETEHHAETCPAQIARAALQASRQPQIQEGAMCLWSEIEWTLNSKATVTDGIIDGGAIPDGEGLFITGATFEPQVQQAVAEGAGDVSKAVALYEAVSAIYFDDSSDFKPALMSAIRALSPEMEEMLRDDPRVAWQKADEAKDAALATKEPK